MAGSCRIFARFYIVVAIIICGCAKASYRQNQSKLVNIYKKQQYSLARDLVVSDDFLPDTSDVLLKNIEKGTAYLSNNNACVAMKFYDNAANILQEQYTKSVKDAIKSGVDLTDGVYYGQTYEKSLLNFYRSLSNYKVYNSGICDKFVPKDEKNKNKTEQQNVKTDDKKLDTMDLRKMKVEDQTLSTSERKQYLNAAKANIMYWDSWMKGRNIASNDMLYMDDLLMKLWGAFIHEQTGASSDMQIAKQLYKDALNVAKNRYAVYKTFNGDNYNFIKNIKTASEREKHLDKDNVYAKDVNDYVDRQLKRIASKKKANIALIVQDGVVSEKIAVNEVNPMSIATLALSGNAAALATSMLSGTIEFEKPKIQQYNNDYKYYYSLWNGQKKIVEYPLVLAEPISDIAYENLQEKISGITLKTQAKVTAQMVAGILAAEIAYTGMKTVDEGLAQLAALGTFAGYSKLIKNAGIVDTRQWVSLPSNIFMVIDNVKDGMYTLKIVKRKNELNKPVNDGLVNTAQERVVYSKDIKIDDKITFIDIRV